MTLSLDLKQLTRPIIMGIVNITPDSFYDGGTSYSYDDAIKRIEWLIQSGADMIDIGAESTRPGAVPVSESDEIERLAPILSVVKSQFDIYVSLDTMKASVAAFGLEHGVDMINDISAMTADPKMEDVINHYKPDVTLMHMKGRPVDMQDNPYYNNIYDDVYSFLEHQVARCKKLGVPHIVIDPGIGFGKTVTHNLTLLRDIYRFKSLHCPIMIGVSHKSFISSVSPSEPHQRHAGSIAANLIAHSNGADIFRVHDVFEMKQAFDVVNAIKQGDL